MLLDGANWASSTRVAMTGFRYNFRLTWIALVAMMGTLSVVGNASASAASGAPQKLYPCLLPQTRLHRLLLPASVFLIQSLDERAIGGSSFERSEVLRTRPALRMPFR